MNISNVLLFCTTLTVITVANAFLRPSASTVRQQKLSMTTDKIPIAIAVTVTIKPDRIDEFLKVMEEDAVSSRTKEPGCLRFDVLRDRNIPNQFVFYEVYVDSDAITFHKNQPHFKLWTDFKNSGGVESQVAIVADGIFYGQ